MKKSPVRFPNNSSHNISVNYCRIDTPYTFEEAMNCKERKNSKEAMNKEIESLNENV